MNPALALAALAPILALIPWTPQPIAFQLGPIPLLWYGIGYAVGLAASYVVITREARRRGLDARRVDNGIIVVAIAALVGGRAYHVIDQWQLYKDDLILVLGLVRRRTELEFLGLHFDFDYGFAGVSGLGVYGGIILGTLVAWLLTRRWHQSFWKWADVVAPGLFVMQAVGRWGNFFNQELYGPPTDLPWGIAIDCAHRVAEYPCETFPVATTGFQPLFLYESLSGILGAIALLWLARRYGRQMRPGDLFLLFVVWYGVVRFALETLRTGNWVVLGIPTAMLVSVVLVAGALVVLAYRHRRGASGGDRWGDPPAPGWDAASDDDADDDDEWVDDDEEADGHAEPGTSGGAGSGEPAPGPGSGEPDGADRPA